MSVDKTGKGGENNETTHRAHRAHGGIDGIYGDSNASADGRGRFQRNIFVSTLRLAPLHQIIQTQTTSALSNKTLQRSDFYRMG